MAQQYPEHDKLHAIADKSQVIGDFIVWLGEKGYSICERRNAKSEDAAKQLISVPQEGTRASRNVGDAFCELMRAVIDSACVYWPTMKRLPNALLAEYFEIDENKIEDEKRAMLEEIRKGHAK